MSGTEVGAKRGKIEEVDSNALTKKNKGGTKIRILVKENYTGALIGRGGENFKRLREQYAVKITGLRSRAEKRVLQLEGDTVDCVSVLKELLSLCPEAPFLCQNHSSPVELNILVNSSQIGAVIGKAGAKLTEIREQSGGFIKVYPDCLPNSNERVVALGGVDESVVLTALHLVLFIINNAPMKSLTIPYDPANTQANQASPLTQMEPLLPVTPHSNWPTVSELANSLDIAQLLFTRQDIKQRNPLPACRDFGQAPTVTRLTVPNFMCEAILGNRGIVARQIMVASGALITLGHALGDEESHQMMTLSGTQDQIQVAEQLMSQIVSANSRFNNTSYV